MAIDFEKLVLGPCIKVFGKTVTFHPDKSQPSQPSFDKPAIYENGHVSVSGLLDHADVSSSTPMLGIRLSDFDTPLLKGDRATTPDGKTYNIVDTQPDGEGGAVLILSE